MSLIKCPECGKEISDKSKQCIHCGYPIESNPNKLNDDNYMCKIDGIAYDFSEIIRLIKVNKPYTAMDYFSKNIKLKNPDVNIYLLEYLDKYNCVPTQINSSNIENVPQNEIFNRISTIQNKFKNIEKQNNKNQLHCPYCQSTNLKKISISNRMLSTALFGIGSKKIGKQWHCNNCGSEW